MKEGDKLWNKIQQTKNKGFHKEADALKKIYFANFIRENNELTKKAIKNYKRTTPKKYQIKNFEEYNVITW